MAVCRAGRAGGPASRARPPAYAPVLGEHGAASDRRPAAGELVLHVFRAIARFERRPVVGRTRDGVAAARARGKRR